MTLLLKSDFKVLFISLFNGEALGTRYLFSAIKNKEFDTRLLFLKVDLEHEKEYAQQKSDFFSGNLEIISDIEITLLMNFITDFQPDVISFSLVSPYFQLYKRLFSSIRKLGTFKIVLGGWHVSLNPESCVPYCNILCIGEGDNAFPELIIKLAENKSIENIPNLWIIDHEKIIKNKVAPLKKDLDLIPNFIFDVNSTYIIEKNKIVNNDPYSSNSRYGTAVSRGCPYHCTYCSNSYMAKNIYPQNWSKIRYRSVNSVIDELMNVWYPELILHI